MQNCHQWQCICGMEYLFKQTLKKHIEKELASLTPPASEVGDHEDKNAESLPVPKDTAAAATTTPVLHGIKKNQQIRPLFECDVCDEVFRASALAVKHRKLKHDIVDSGEPQIHNHLKSFLRIL